jgi:voltage-gated potassium channel
MMAWLSELLDTTGLSLPARLFRLAHALMLIAGLGAVIFGTDPASLGAHSTLISIIFAVAVVFFTLELLLRLVVVPRVDVLGHALDVGTARITWLASLQGMVDLAGVLPLLALATGSHDLRLLGVFWVMKLGRHSPRLGLLGRVLRHAREPMTGVFFAFLIILFLAATLEYLIEGRDNPAHFGSIPLSLWWAVTTLTTTGYGDAVPQTEWGRLLGGSVMVCGIAVFALWAGILASEFAQEMRRHDFLRTWDLVAKVPFFEKLGAESIAEVTRLLKPREVMPGSIVVRRGEPGDRMFFIVGGEVEIQVSPKPIMLGAGSFFGEIALITRGPRTATVVARRHTVLLELDIADFRELAARRPELTRAIDEEATRRVKARAQSAAS